MLLIKLVHHFKNYKKMQTYKCASHLAFITLAMHILDMHTEPEEEPPVAPGQGRGLMYAQGPQAVYGNFFCSFYRTMHFSAYARSWDRMSSVRPSVRPSVCPSVRL